MKTRVNFASALIAAALLAGIMTSPASAEPVLGLQLTRAAAPAVPVTHSDERLAYELTAENTASPNPSLGTELTCRATPVDGSEWFGSPMPTFEVEWLRNGVLIPGTRGPAAATPNGNTYTVVAEDEGKTLQCVVIGTNDADGAGTTYAPISAATVSRPPTVVEPVPAIMPPSGTSRPIFGAAVPAQEGKVLACEVPTEWSGTGITWGFQILRNGEPIPGATNANYTVTSADISPPSELQCEAIAKNAGGEAVSISQPARTEPGPAPPYTSPAPFEILLPAVAFNNKSEGKVMVEVELPPGTQALRILGSEDNKVWDCAKTPPTSAQPSTATCSREDSLNPGNAYPPILLVAQVLQGAADTLVTKATASGGGALTSASAEDTVSGILPAVPFGFADFKTEVLDQLGNEFKQAGGHPFSAGANLALTEHMKAERNAEAGFRAANGFARVIKTETPPGFVGNPEAVEEKCPTIANVIELPSACPAASVVGGITLDTGVGPFTNQPIYEIEPERGTPAQFAFGVAQLAPGFAYTLTPELRPQDGYAISLVTAPVQKTPELFGAKATLCGFGAKVQVNSAHEAKFAGCKKPLDGGAFEKPFLSLPTRCGDTASSTTRILADSWEEPGNFSEAKYTLPAPEGCNALQFEPSLKARPTTNNADSPTGLEVDLTSPKTKIPKAPPRRT